jgi:hypothetical protein
VRHPPEGSSAEHEDGDDGAADRADERTDDRSQRRVRRTTASAVDVDDAVRGERAEEAGGDHSDEREHDDAPRRDTGWLIFLMPVVGWIVSGDAARCFHAPRS